MLYLRALVSTWLADPEVDHIIRSERWPTADVGVHHTRLCSGIMLLSLACVLCCVAYSHCRDDQIESVETKSLTVSGFSFQHLPVCSSMAASHSHSILQTQLHKLRYSQKTILVTIGDSSKLTLIIRN